MKPITELLDIGSFAAAIASKGREAARNAVQYELDSGDIFADEDDLAEWYTLGDDDMLSLEGLIARHGGNADDWVLQGAVDAVSGAAWPFLQQLRRTHLYRHDAPADMRDLNFLDVLSSRRMHAAAL